MPRLKGAEPRHTTAIRLREKYDEYLRRIAKENYRSPSLQVEALLMEYARQRNEIYLLQEMLDGE